MSQSDPLPVVLEAEEELVAIDVMVCKGFSGEIVRATIALDDTVEEAVPLIADQITYYTSDYEKIGIYNMTQDFEYRMNDTFRERNTRGGDLLFMADGQACHK